MPPYTWYACIVVGSCFLRCDASKLGISRRFEGTCHLHLQGFKVREDEGDTFFQNVGKSSVTYSSTTPL
jgi:hypothetical protein